MRGREGFLEEESTPASEIDDVFLFSLSLLNAAYEISIAFFLPSPTRASRACWQSASSLQAEVLSKAGRDRKKERKRQRRFSSSIFF